MNKPIRKRIFLFGCPRSGTTLLQVILARHPEVYSLPESFFFSLTVGYRRKLLARWNITTGREKYGLMKTSEILGLKSSPLPYKRSLFYKPTVDTFVNYFDRITVENDKSIWLEKTPFHNNYIDIIKKYVPEVHFIHIIRDGKDTVASIVDRAYKHDTTLFAEKEKDPRFGIRKWNNAMRISSKHIHDPDHSFVSYEALACDPDRVLNKLCEDLGIAYLPEMKDPKAGTTDKLTQYTHLKNSSKSIKPAESKFDGLFDEATRQDIIKQLDWNNYNIVKEYAEGVLI